MKLTCGILTGKSGSYDFSENRIKENSMGLIEYVGSIGGVGAVFGVIILLIYRQTVKQMREDRKYTEDRMSDVLSAYNTNTKENTKILSELYTWLKAKNGG